MRSQHSLLKRLAIAGPALAIAGVVTRPYVPNFLDRAAIADLATAGSTRWVAATVLLASGMALSAVALGLIARAIAARTGQRSGQWVMPAAVLAASAMAYQFGASGIGVYGTATSGGDIARFLTYAAGWETPAYIMAVAILGVAVISAAWASTAAGIVNGRWATVAKIAAVVTAGGFLLPSSAGEYLSVIALAVLLRILVLAIDREPASATP